jgi:hypothetical protein
MKVLASGESPDGVICRVVKLDDGSLRGEGWDVDAGAWSTAAFDRDVFMLPPPAVRSSTKESLGIPSADC